MIWSLTGGVLVLLFLAIKATTAAIRLSDLRIDLGEDPFPLAMVLGVAAAWLFLAMSVALLVHVGQA